MRVRCPSCGISHEVEEKKTVTFESRLRNVASLAVTPISQGSSITPGSRREAPAGMPNRETHVDVPFSQAKITGFFAAPIGGVIAYTAVMIIDATPTIEVTAWGQAAVTICGAVVVGFSVAGWMWLRRLGVYDGLLWTIEEATGFDLDGDNQVGQPVAPRVDIEFQEKGIPRETETLDIDLPRLTILASLIVLDNKSFSERTATEAGISREEWIPLRDKLIARRWAKWNHPTETKQGVSLQPKGWAILRSILGGDEGKNNVPGSTHPRPTNGSGNNYERFEYIERR